MIKESLLFEKNPNPSFIYNRESHQILAVNKAAIQKYGYSRKEFLELTLEDIRPEEDIPVLDEVIDNLRDGVNVSGPVRHQTKSGKIIYVQVTSQSYDSEEFENSRIVTAYDITEQQKLKEKRNLAYQELDHHIKNAPLAYVKWDSNFQVIEWSKEAERYTGYSKGEVVGRHLKDFFRSDFRSLKKIIRRLQKVKMGELSKDTFELSINNKKGEPIEIRLHASALMNEEGGVKSIFTFIENITEEKKRENRLQKQIAYVRFVNELAQVINKVVNYKIAVYEALHKITEHLGWSVGHAYEIREDLQYRSSGIWYTSASSEKYDPLKIVTKNTWFQKGYGFIGRVIEEKEPQIIHNINDNDEFVRTKNRNLPVNTCFAFPVIEEDKIQVVLEFFTEENTCPDPFFVESIALVQHQLVRVFERLKSREILEKREEKYHKLFENANDGIFILQGEHIVDCNSKAEEIFGYSKKEIVGKTPFHFSPEKQSDGATSRQKGKELIKKALAGESLEFEWDHINKEGGQVHSKIHLEKLELSDGTYLQAILRDLTQQKKAEEEIKKREKLFKSLFLKSPAAMVMIDHENRVKMVNDSFESLFGYTEEELKGKDLDSIIVPEDEYDEAPKMPADDFTEGKLYAELTRYSKDGERIDVLLGAIPVYLDGEPLAGFGIYIDISDQKRIQKELEKSLQEKELLLAEIHHRVKNNLAVISALLQLKVLRYENEDVGAILENSLLRIKTMALVHDTLYKTEDFANLRFKNYIRKLIELNKQTLQREDKSISIKTDVDDIEININQAIPCALLINELITNAFKHAFENNEDGEIRISLKKEKDTLHVVVADNGKGLPSDVCVSGEGGDSLGFNLIRTLVEQLDAELNYKYDNGSVFSYSFELKELKGSASHHI